MFGDIFRHPARNDSRERSSLGSSPTDIGGGDFDGHIVCQVDMLFGQIGLRWSELAAQIDDPFADLWWQVAGHLIGRRMIGRGLIRRQGAAGAHCHNYSIFGQYPSVFTPRRDILKRICTHDEEELAPGIELLQFPKSLDRVGAIRRVKLDRRENDSRRVDRCQGQHCHSMVRGTDLDSALMRWNGSRNQQQSFEVEGLDDSSGYPQVTFVERVECSTIDGYPPWHMRYQLSGLTERCLKPRYLQVDLRPLLLLP